MNNLIILLLLFSFSNSLAQFSWHPLADGLDSTVMVLKEHNGYIYAGGSFSDAGGDPDADCLAKWDGNQWQAVAPGLTGQIQTIAFQNTNILVGGLFTVAGGNPDAHNIASWDGNNWNALGQGLSSIVMTIAVSGNSIYAGGIFDNAGGNANADNIAHWDGNIWNALGTGLNSDVNTIAVNDNLVYAGGPFTNAGGNANGDGISYWNGSSWNAMGAGLPNQVVSIVLDGNDIYAAGMLIVGDVARWDGAAWIFYPDLTLNDWVNNIAIVGEEIYAAAWSDGLYHWDGSNWSLIFETELPGTWYEIIYDVIVTESNVCAGGYFDLDEPGVVNIAQSIASPLAIELNSFKVIFDEQQNKVRIEWISTDESNTDYFTLERSSDGISFNPITQITHDGIDDGPQHHTTYDPDPLPGINYYRLRETSIDGLETYSSIETIDASIRNNSVFCYPNPVKDKLFLLLQQIELSEIKVWVYSVLNSADIAECELQGDRITIDMSDYASGIYVIDVEADGMHTMQKIIKE